MNADEMFRDLGVLQVSDSFFPTGLYSTSSGLETLLVEGPVSKEDLVEFISAQIAQQLGPCDCVALANVVGLAERHDLESILEVDETVFAIKAVREAREASCSSGTQLSKTVHRFAGDGVLSEFLEVVRGGSTPCTYPVAFGVCSHALGIDRERAALSFLYGFVVSVVGAALRLGVIQHLEGQEIIHELKPEVIGAVRGSMDVPASEIWQFSPHLDICQMRHEKMDSRMFIT